MKKTLLANFGAALAGLCCGLTALASYPHGEVSGLSCSSCHVPIEGVGPLWFPADVIHDPVDRDDTACNSLCRSCHNDVLAPAVATHSSLSTSDTYGTWKVECRVCHWSHGQEQYGVYRAASLLATGTWSEVGESTLKANAPSWAESEHKGRILLPDLSTPYGYKITDNSMDSVTVNGPSASTHASVGDSFGIIYGKLIHSTIKTPNSGSAPVRFFGKVGAKSYADGDGTYDGVCEVCHTQTNHHRNGPAGDHSHFAGTWCIGCHKHENGFKPGGAGGAHETHATAQDGPRMACSSGVLACHGPNIPPFLSDGKSLLQTASCDACHGGSSAAAKAKQYWASPGSSSGTPGSWAAVEGEASFCGSCHDATPGNSRMDGSGTAAANVLGNNTTYGFYVTGHGKPSGNYQRLVTQGSTGTGNPAANRACADCHEFSSDHFDTANKRLKAGFENDQANTTCKNCHIPGNAYADPMLYTTSEEYEAKNHGGLLCTACHEVHGAVAGAYPGMARGGARALCLGCHTDDPPNPPGAPAPPPADHNTSSTTPCVQCHNPHKPAHGGGTSGSGCGDCHGKHLDHGGAGTTLSHATHTETDSHGVRGPGGLGCNDCHDINNFPYFKSGTDANSDGRYNLAETDVCHACHSPGGTYDGVNDSAIGAKANWATGVYVGNDLAYGMEKWCATCHDELPSVVASVSAPNVIGGESEAFDYGTGWGFYKTGHGLGTTSAYPASGGTVYGAGKPCSSCHDYALAHVDGFARTFDCTDGCDSTEYRQAYRLKFVDGEVPLVIPRPNMSELVAEDFRLCLANGCHDANRYLRKDPPVTTSFRDDRGDAPHSGGIPPINAHELHLNKLGLRFDADWAGGYEGQISCVNCHNVHGSTRLSMVRDGKLVNREPGLVIYYAKDGVTTYNPPWPPNPPHNYATLAESDGTVWGGASPGNLCSACHGGNYGKYYRTPPPAPAVPVLAWTESDTDGDGVDPNSGPGGEHFTFQVKYSDSGSQIPRSIQVWIDRNKDGDYADADEKLDMQDAEPADLDCSDGKRYRKTVALSRVGDGVLSYRFYASDGASEAAGAPTSVRTLTVSNNPPVLAWTGESGFEADGVNPNAAAGGSSFTFRVRYSDANNNAPTIRQVWIDLNDDGSYDPGEKLPLDEVDGGDTNYADGKLYALTRAISPAGDGTLTYRFHASDGSDAVGPPTADHALTVTSGNSAPTLSWTNESGYVRDGVEHDAGSGTTSFAFRVQYADADNNPPAAIQVWVDEDGDGVYAAGEKHALSEVDSGGADYSEGKLFIKTLSLTAGESALINYRFVATDGTFAATGTPTEDSFLTLLVNAVKVSCLGGTGYETTIQAAVNASSSGDTILVSPCTYTEKVAIDGKSLTIRSTGGTAATFIDGGGSGGSVVKFLNGANSVLDGFTVRNGEGGFTGGGGIYISNSSPTLANCTITNNDADNGAGIYVAAGSSVVTLSNSTVSNNTTSALEGGGLYLGSGASAVIGGSAFSGNQGRYGGAVYLTTGADASLTITDSLFSGNRGTLAGGALYVTASGGTVPVAIDNTTFSSNDANDNGGALFMSTGSAPATLTITDSTFTGNNTTVQGSPLDGGAIYLVSVSSTSISGSTFSENVGRSGGALYVTNSGANSLSIIDSTVNQNSASALQGGGLYLAGGAAGTYTANIERTTIAGNDADDSGGGAYLTGSVAATFTNCMITGNKAVVLDGGGLHVTGATVAPRIVNTTIAGNYANDQGGGIYNLGGATFDIANSILWNNRDYDDYPDLAGPAAVSYSAVRQSGFEGNGNFHGNPLFVSPASASLAPTTAGNYHLQLDSPGRDAGTAAGAPDDDIDGNVRPIGLGIDMGADEIVTVADNTPTLSWTGEAGFTADGVNPDVGASGATFQLRINYADTNNQAPSAIEAWVDADDNGVYEAGEKHALTAVDAGDLNHADGKLYATSLALPYAGDGVLKYRFYAADGYTAATGRPTSDSTLLVNSGPILSWTGSEGYVADGVNPDSGANGTSFEFRVRYMDPDNNPPTSIQVWVDRNDDGDYLDDGEKLTLAAVDPGDTIYADGKDYARTVTLTKAGDDVLKYRFYASDGNPAVGEPATTEKTLAVTNNVPVLAWTGEPGFTVDGVNPDSAVSGSSYEFRVKYTDADNEPPALVHVWIDRNDDGDYLDVGEKIDLIAVDAGDTTYSDGKLYARTLNLDTAGDGNLSYRFYAMDGSDAATGGPTANASVGVTGANTPPTLTWTGEANYTADGVDPDSGLGGTNFTFRVKYADVENTPPTPIQAWIDENDDGDYLDAGEQLDLTAVDAGDTTYSDGKLYTVTTPVPFVADGTVSYRFYANDGIVAATGSAAADKTVAVASAITVCASGCNFTTIQAAINDADTTNGKIVLVSSGTYSENINYNSKVITIQSASGAAATKIQGSGANSPVVTFANSALTGATVLDGFTIDNQATANTLTRGISITAGAAPTIKNCLVEGNVMSTGQNGAGIYISGGAATIQSSTLGGNSANKNSCASGCGLYATALSGPLFISNTIVSENTGTSNGAGINLNANGAQTTTITNAIFVNNTATQSGGAIYNNGSLLSIGGSSAFTTNSAGANQNGGAICSIGANASTTIADASFTNNSSGGQGGAVYLTGSTAAVPLSISNSTFTGSTTNQNGGAIALATVTNPTAISSTNISGSSTAVNKGGAIYASSAPATLTNVNIVNSTSALEGGGLYATGATSALNITGGSINGNTGTVGGGVYLTTSATLQATGTTISGNRATSSIGGGIYNAAGITLTKVALSGNRANQRGGGLYAAGGPVTLTNCLVTGNTADQQSYSTGGGIHDAGGAVSIFSSTIAGNFATSSAGGFYATGTDDVVRNCVFWGNTAGSNAQINNGWPTTTYTDIQGGCASCGDKTGNIDVNPQFLNPQQASSGNPTAAGDFHILLASPCVDAASAANAPADDIDGQPRPYDVAGRGDGADDHDMGADEYVP